MKKFEIQLAGQILFLIVIEIEEDLEIVMEGRPWLFRKKLVLFDRLTKLIERSQIRLNSSPFWNKIGPCLLEVDKKDLLHAIGVTFGGVLRYDINRDVFRLRIKLNVQKPLRRGDTEKLPEMNSQKEDRSAMIWRSQDNLQSIEIEMAMKMQEEGSVVKENETLNERNSIVEGTPKPVKKTNWKRIGPAISMSQNSEESIKRKRKSAELEIEEC
ncbi:hypothetical protein J1N35_004727 [Gossypium stocksii]|uniref:DUF4283 domain-containing protein n=1 Tax=Gossypium stocksii TaxID=47602 RepID=A0A9D3WDC5_9ROSI|nr:hypothetical protein J1N35_004727 [Gossypium stocksii]